MEAQKLSDFSQEKVAKPGYELRAFHFPGPCGLPPALPSSPRDVLGAEGVPAWLALDTPPQIKGPLLSPQAAPSCCLLLLTEASVL